MALPDTTVYRTPGTWGEGKGSNLTPAEVDANFYGLVARLASLEDNPAEGVGIADFSVVGTALTVFMNDGTTRGPFRLPAAVFRFTGEWEASTVYAFMDVFTITEGEHSGLYWVLADYVAPGVFSPTAKDEDDRPLLQLILPGAVPPARLRVIHVVDSDHTLAAGEAGAYVRMKSAAPHSVFVDLGGEAFYLEGDTFGARQVGEGPVTLVPMDPAVTLTPPPGFTLTLRGPGASASLIYAGGDEWDVSGDLAPEV